MARWRVDIIRKRAEHLGTVRATSGPAALVAFEQHAAGPNGLAGFVQSPWEGVPPPCPVPISQPASVTQLTEAGCTSE